MALCTNYLNTCVVMRLACLCGEDVLIVVVVATVSIVNAITDISICVVLTGVNRKDICDSMPSSHMRGGL